MFSLCPPVRREWQRGALKRSRLVGNCEAVRLRQTHEELINFLDSCSLCFAMRLHPERSPLPPGTRRLKLDKRTNAAIESAKRSEACSAARSCPEPSLDKRSG